MSEQSWPWQCQQQDPTHTGWCQPGDRDHPPSGGDVRCVTYLADYDRAHPDHPLCNPPREGFWVYCRAPRVEGSPLTAAEAARADANLDAALRALGVA